MTVPKGLRGYHPPIAPEDQAVPTHVSTPELGPLVPIMSNSPDQWTAKTGMILRTLAGSEAYGTNLDTGGSDRDEMGVCMEHPRTVIGSGRFEHYKYRSAAEGQVSRAGDLDLIVYGLRKFVRLAAAGNPTVLGQLFVAEDHVLYATDLGRALLGRRHMFLSRAAAPKFRGYLHSQRQGLLGMRSGGSRNQGRADIRARHGYDVKFAMHMIRLGLQCVELLSTGTLVMPIREPDRTYLREIRAGRHKLPDLLAHAEELERQFTALAESSTALPERPDMDAIDQWVIDAHRLHWGWS